MKKIYVKLNGTFQEYEDTQQIRQGLHIDKQIAEQRGDTWEQYDQDNLPDEDALTLGVITQREIDDKKKENRKAEIKSLLHDIDMKSIRPARAGETAKLQELEAEAEKLRAELNGIK